MTDDELADRVQVAMQTDELADTLAAVTAERDHWQALWSVVSSQVGAAENRAKAAYEDACRVSREAKADVDRLLARVAELERQLERTMDFVKSGPLPERLEESIDKFVESVDSVQVCDTLVAGLTRKVAELESRLKGAEWGERSNADSAVHLLHRAAELERDELRAFLKSIRKKIADDAKGLTDGPFYQNDVDMMDALLARAPAPKEGT